LCTIAHADRIRCETIHLAAILLAGAVDIPSRLRPGRIYSTPTAIAKHRHNIAQPG
jgi:hypothetical protein